MHNHWKWRCLSREARRILAHQNPPSPDARIVKPLTEEGPGVRLKSPLKTTRRSSTRDITISDSLAQTECFLRKTRATTRLTAHRIAEKTFARSPGMTMTYGLRNASCSDVKQNTIQAAFSPIEAVVSPPETILETLSLIAPTSSWKGQICHSTPSGQQNARHCPLDLLIINNIGESGFRNFQPKGGGRQLLR